MSVFRPNATALVTGGASGIGFAIAQLCRAHSMHITLVDLHESSLAAAKTSLEQESQGAVETIAADVGDTEAWAQIKEGVLKQFGAVDLLVLNAGMTRKGGWEDVSYWRDIMTTNLFGVVNGISAFLPVLEARTEPSAIVITGSKQGITNPPGNPAYNASKAAVKSLAEQLSYDLRASPTSVHLLVPGWTFTGMTGAGANKTKPDGAWTPKQVVDYLYDQMRAGQFYVLCPDNDTSKDKDKKRILWSAGDAIEGRPPLSRWREDWKDKAEAWMEKAKV